MNTMATEQPYLKNAIAGVLALEPYSPGMPIDELQRRLGIDNAVKLASNENPLGPSPKVKEALAGMITDSDIARYPDGAGFKLKKKISEFHGIEPERITLGNGSNDIIEFIARVFLGPGRAAMYSAHAFAVYPIVAQAQDAESVVVPALPEDHPDMPFGHDLAGFAKALRPDVTVIFLVNPNNPTGTWMRPDEIEAFLKHVPSHTLVVLDEAYQEFLDPSLRPDSRAWLDRYPNLIVLRTFSKMYGLAGLRVGYLVGSPQVVDLIRRAYVVYSVNTLAQAAARAAVEHGGEHIQATRALMRAGKAFLREALSLLGVPFLCHEGSYVMIKVPISDTLLYRRLMKRGLMIRTMSGFRFPNWIRVTVVGREVLEQFVEGLAQELKSAL